MAAKIISGSFSTIFFKADGDGAQLKARRAVTNPKGTKFFKEVLLVKLINPSVLGDYVTTHSRVAEIFFHKAAAAACQKPRLTLLRTRIPL